ncbi:MAG: DUF6051 family protein [Bacteroidetes bacterium]|nr:DUF6051 family protein [Bacteroidota bacterium]
MKYTESHKYLMKTVDFDKEVVDLGDVEVRNISFESKAYDLIPGAEEYKCEDHNLKFGKPRSFVFNTGHEDELIDIADTQILENRKFYCPVFFPKREQGMSDVGCQMSDVRYPISDTGRAKRGQRLILLFHGFNEKSWDKYLPWALKLVRETGKPVVMFPIAFHMNRAPVYWVEKRSMFALSGKRKQHFPNAMKSSLSNVAISIRLHSQPQRFIWSGLQTYYDVIRFTEECRKGTFPGIEEGCSFDFFSYSIGSLLAEILKLSDYKGFFTDSKLAMFCGGAVFNRLSPVSKFILDSEANVALYSFLVEHIDNHLKRDPRLRHYLGPGHPEGYNLLAMLDYRNMREYREEKFRQMHEQVLAVTLKADKVVPAYEVINTLQGAARDIPIPVEIFDFPYPYIHEDPFPTAIIPADMVDEAFDCVFDRITNFLRS